MGKSTISMAILIQVGGWHQFPPGKGGAAGAEGPLPLSIRNGAWPKKTSVPLFDAEK